MKPIYKILYVSTLCSPILIDFIFKTSTIKPSQAAQKFHRLLAEGLAMHDKACKLETISTIPVISRSHRKRFWNLSSEVVRNVRYNYVPMINLPILKNLIVFLYSLFRIVLWGLLGGRKEKVALCDVLNLSIASAALLACKLTGIKVISIVTDLPDLMVQSSQNKSRLKFVLYDKIVSSMLTNFDGYVILTEQINKVVNSASKPYLIMEGSVDIGMKTSDNLLDKKSCYRILMYAGGIYEKYGVKRLIEAFMKLEGNDLRLHIYGSGEMENELQNFLALDNRISYFGIVPNKIIVEKLSEATLLINPRPTHEEFTKYSFPSKNLEYMVSGTPIVTTTLPGMPSEYYDYVYVFIDESSEGMYNTLKMLLSKSRIELHNFGAEAKKFVLVNKNNFIQAQRVLDLIN